MSIRVSEREKRELPRGKLKDILESNQNTQIKDLCPCGGRLFKDVCSPMNDLRVHKIPIKIPIGFWVNLTDPF